MVYLNASSPDWNSVGNFTVLIWANVGFTNTSYCYILRKFALLTHNDIQTRKAEDSFLRLFSFIVA